MRIQTDHNPRSRVRHKRPAACCCFAAALSLVTTAAATAALPTPSGPPTPHPAVSPTPIAPSPTTGGKVERHYSTSGGSADGTPALTVTLSLESDRLRTADRANLLVVVAAAPGVRTEWTPPTEMLGEWQVAHSATRERTSPDGGHTAEHLIELEPFLDGDKAIPAMSFRYATGPSGPWRVLSTDPIPVRVTAVVADGDAGAALGPSKPPIAILLGASWQRWLIGGLALATALAYPAAFLSARLRARRRRAAIDPIADALATLDALERDLRPRCEAALPADPATHSRLAAAARLYLSAACGRDTRGLLADELAPFIRAHATAAGDSEPVIAVLRDLDTRRFGPSSADAREALAQTTTVRRFIDQTRPHLNRAAAPAEGVAA